jgi:hypothetical protein
MPPTPTAAATAATQRAPPPHALSARCAARPQQYGDADYWDQRYAAEPTLFDWYITFAGLAPVLTRHVAQDARILQLGVGTSALQAQMVEQGGYQQVLSIDISRVAIKHMQQLHAKLPQLKYRVGDARCACVRVRASACA